MAEGDADTIVILSSELIAKITEQYFNKVMFKQQVSIVDLRPHGESGYAFSVIFKEKEVKVTAVEVQELIEQVKPSLMRQKNGRFMKTS